MKDSDDDLVHDEAPSLAYRLVLGFYIPLIYIILIGYFAIPWILRKLS